MRNGLIIGIFLYSFFSSNIMSQEIEPISLQTGLWEGISGHDYKLLEINANGQHRMINGHIPSGFRKAQFLPFTDNDISCNSTECTINIIKTKLDNEVNRLIISPYLDNSFKVLEIIATHNGEPILTKTYQLDKQLKQSTPRKYKEMFKQQLKSLTSINDGNIYGFWIGVLVLHGKHELISFEVNPDKKSHFVRFINGSSITNETSFDPEKMTIFDSSIKIETEHSTFANELIIHQISKSMLRGYMYSIHKGKPLQSGQFSLYRLQL